jgi:cell division protein FtsI/penicillin-binding protein 2
MRRVNRNRQVQEHQPGVPERANRILNFLLIVMFVILIRLWHLGVVQHESRLEESRRPQRRSVVEKAARGTIRDRFNIPLAINRVQYNAAISYAEIREIPSVVWEANEDGRRVKKYARREHISKLAERLGEELDIDPRHIEDIIYSKASLFPNVPYVIQENIDERRYCRLKALEKDFPGLCAERAPLRFYPRGRVACDIIGYMGSITQGEHERVLSELRRLEAYIQERDAGHFPPLPEGMGQPSEVRERLHELRERAYSIHDQVGKSGVEGEYDEQLRGYHGRHGYLLDIYGNHLRPLPGGQAAVPGKRVILSISAELQEFAEQLLAEGERIRDGRSHRFDRESRTYSPLKQPWIKGGSIIALDPKSGEILAMASYPRFDPNDFIAAGDREERKRRGAQVLKWLETEDHVGMIWDRKQLYTRENYVAKSHSFEDQAIDLTWENYLNLILPDQSPVRVGLARLKGIGEAILVQRLFAEIMAYASGWEGREVINLLYSREEDVAIGSAAVHGKEEAKRWLQSSEVQRRRSELDRYFCNMRRNYDKLLFVDLCRLAVRGDSFSADLIQAVGMRPISLYREATAASAVLLEVVQEMARELFHQLDFAQWREENQKKYLAEKRKEEKEAGKYQRPYLDYLDAFERAQFAAFWESNRWNFLLAFVQGVSPSCESSLLPYYDHFLTWATELDQGAHQTIEWRRWYTVLKGELSSLSLDLARLYCETMKGYRELTEPVYGRYRYIRESEGVQTLQNLAAAFYPRYGHGYGRSYAYRQAAPQGSVFKVVTAYEALTQRWAALAAAGSYAKELNPLTITDEAYRSGSGKRDWNVGQFADGRPIPMYYKGGRLLPTLRQNVGEIGLDGAMEVSSNPYFGLLVSDYMKDPEDLNRAARALSYGGRTGIDLPGEYSGRLPNDLSSNRNGLYSYAIGQHSLVVTPLQTATMMAAMVNGGRVFQPKVLRLIAGSEPIREGDRIFRRRHYAFKNSLALLGFDFPLFTGVDRGEELAEVQSAPSMVVREVPMEPPVRESLLHALRQPIVGARGGARPMAARSYHDHPWMLRDYKSIQDQMVGKTSTAEIVESVDLDPDEGINTYNHVWFAGASFEPCENGVWYESPELVVVVYLRFGDYGKETGPVAAQMVKKWREIRDRESSL